MTAFLNEVAFIHAGSQGHFLVTYDISGMFRIFTQAVPVDRLGFMKRMTETELLDLAQTESCSGTSSLMYSWGHDQDVGFDRTHLSQDGLISKYRRIFETVDLGKTHLETPEQSKLARVEFRTASLGDELRVVLRADGLGFMITDEEWDDDAGGSEWTLRASYPHDPFHHAVSQDLIVADAAAMTVDVRAAFDLRTQYETLFWQTINPTIDPPWIRTNDEIYADAAEFAKGTMAEFRDILADAGSIDEIIWENARYSKCLSVLCADAGSPAHIHNLQGDYRYMSERSRKLLDIIVSWFEPKGFEFHHNGGPENRWSGYDRYALHIHQYIKPPTATERMEALERLVSWADRNGIAIDDYLPA
mgnify:CR=1 FL=1